MQTTKREVTDAAIAYYDGVLDPNREMSPILAYRISKNVTEIRRVHTIVAGEIEIIRTKYGWDSSKPDGGLDPEMYSDYTQEYNALLDEKVDLDFIMIKISEIDFNVTTNEMRLLAIMIDPEG